MDFKEKVVEEDRRWKISVKTGNIPLKIEELEAV